jgi:NADH-quinone oxidoreductase subunit N
MISLLAQAPVAPIKTPDIDWFAIAPEMALFGSALLIVLVRALARRSRHVFEASLVVAAVGIVTSVVFTFVLWHFVDRDGPYQAIAGMVAVDGFSVFVRTVVLVCLTLALLISVGYLRRERLEAPEYIALMMLSATGMMVMASANDLIAIFLALEILSIALYVLSAFDRERLTSQEAGLKYFLLGAFSSAVFLYGVALTYGATGTTSLTGIARFLSANALLDNGVLFVGFGLLLVGLGFKIAAAPFHMWTPDVYEGAPTPVTAFMAGATKAAAFGAILRVFVGTFDLYRVDWRPAVFGLAVISMAVGTIAAVVQTDVKRMLAYSSIAHAGFVLIGVQAATKQGTSAALFYLLVYALMIIGAFAVVMVVARRGDERHSLEDFRGMSKREPVLAGLLTLFLLAQAGVPLTGGFVAKLGVFEAAVDASHYPLGGNGMITAGISPFGTERNVLAMYAPDAEAPAEDLAPLRVDAPTGIALFLASIAIVTLGIIPGFALDFARDATLLLAR